MERRVVVAGTLGCLLLVLGGGVAGASLTASDGVVTANTTGVVADASVPMQGPGGVAVDSSIAGGETELLVGLSGSASGPDPGASGRASTTPAAVAGMQARAAQAQRPLRAFAARTPGMTVLNRFWLTNAVLVRVDTDRVPVHALARIQGVETITRNGRVKALDTGTRQVAASDTRPSPTPESETAGTTVAAKTADRPATTYGLAQINATETWERYDTRGGGTDVTVIDTGVDADHPDLDISGWAEFDDAGNRVDSTPRDFGSHGTHVTGTVAGGNASGQYVGVAPDANVSHGAVLTDCGGDGCSGSASQIIAGMEWAVANDADVLSMSIVCKGYCTWPVDAAYNAEQANTTVVAAIGNNGETNSSSPGNIYDTISVGASDSGANIAPFSSGEQIDSYDNWGFKLPHWPEQYVVPGISAPGAAVESTEPGGTYGLKWGTSMATPHVAGAIALIESAVDRPLAPDDIEDGLEATAWKPADWPEPEDERDTRYGRGIIDVPAAIEYLDIDLTATFTTEPAVPVPGEAVIFDAGNATGNITEYRWDFDGDGTVETTTAGPTANYTYATTGQRTAALTVVNATGGTNQTSVQVTVREPATPALSNLSVAGGDLTVPVGENRSVAVEVTNAGELNGSLTVTLTVGTTTRTASTATLGAGETTTLVFENVTGTLAPGNYTVTATAGTDTVTQSLSVLLPTMGSGPPTDPDGDGLYEDVRGSGTFTVLDVQALFDHLDAPAVQNYPAAFRFSTAGGSVSVLDVQALFNELPEID